MDYVKYFSFSFSGAVTAAAAVPHALCAAARTARGRDRAPPREAELPRVGMH